MSSGNTKQNYVSKAEDVDIGLLVPKKPEAVKRYARDIKALIRQPPTLNLPSQV